MLLLSLNINITNSTFTTSSYKHWQSTQHVKKNVTKAHTFFTAMVRMYYQK